ncbi:flavoprotein WrbA [Schizophyllum commune H4-8]|uniref:Flavodoxin-like domain-containing protein n=1 Tax=Schizophyllum commune (strain H4-8 / FGSC 9210) TaxID=578458 RepID=D8PQQ9_SCHCM|nr:flavoprotein WrbA [Schizophyllum commune H4-8]KAI5898148.1 flavoprotein WrbA [Schizophyllum commune H4-8]
MTPRVAVVIYTMYGHVGKLAEAVKSGVHAAGGTTSIYQVPETLPKEVLDRMHAPPKPDYPIASADTLRNYDGFLFGIPTRYGNFPGQWKAFWDTTGQLWSQGALSGKFCSAFVSTSSQGGGQEMTVANAMSTFVHHGMIFVPLGYSRVFKQLGNNEEVHGGSAWGAGTFAGGDGSRQPTPLELEVAKIQGQQFWETLAKHSFK